MDIQRHREGHRQLERQGNNVNDNRQKWSILKTDRQTRKEHRHFQIDRRVTHRLSVTKKHTFVLPFAPYFLRFCLISPISLLLIPFFCSQANSLELGGGGQHHRRGNNCPLVTPEYAPGPLIENRRLIKPNKLWRIIKILEILSPILSLIWRRIQG